MNTKPGSLFSRILGTLAILTLLTTVLSQGLTPPPAQAVAGFVGRSGTHFVLDGNNFYVAGTNSHYLGWGTHAEVDSMLGYAQASNYNVVRTIMHSVIGSLDGTTKTTIWNWQSTGDVSNMGMRGVYIIYWNTATNTYAFNTSTSTGLGRWDYVIWKAEQLGLKLDISLLDFWQWAGGVQQVNSWYGSTDRYTFFYSDPRTKQMYKDWVSTVLNRTNTLTGRQYKNEPAIFAWDLMNEPECSSVSLCQSWYQEMASYIKTIDANHLVGTGSEGFFGGQAGSDPTTEATNAPAIDFQTWHTYTNYHNLTSQQVINLINQHCAQAVTNNRPVLMQEFATPASTASEKQARATTYQSWLNTIYNNNDCAGWTYWRLEGRVKLAPTTSFPGAETDPAQAPNGWPPDNGEHFSIYGETDTSSSFYDPSYAMFASAAAQLRTKNGPPPTPTRTSTPCTTCTATPTVTQTPTKTLTPTPSRTPTITLTPAPSGAFIKGININGNAVTIEGNLWLSYSAALSSGFAQSGGLTDLKNLTPNPPTDPDTTAMLNSLLYSSTDPGNINMTQTLPNGGYQVFIWDMENFASNSRSFNLKLEGVQVASGLGTIPLNDWRRYGPYNTTVNDGVLNIDLIGVTGRSMIMGLAIYQTSGSTPTPTNTSSGPTNTPTPTPTRTNTPVGPTNTPTNTSVGPTNTPTNTSPPPTNTPTRTNTPTGPTNTPTKTNTPAAGTIKVQYRAGNNNGTDAYILPHMMLQNTGTSGVPFSELKIRYWYTGEGVTGGVTEIYRCNYAFVGCGNVIGTIVTIASRPGADRYLEISFTAGAGTLPAGSTNQGEIQNEIHKSDFSNYTESGDYSWDGTKDCCYVDWTKMTAYRNGSLVWGTEP